MSGTRNPEGRQVAVVIGATSKWQSDGRNTRLAHGSNLDDSELPVDVRWGVGGAIAQKFAREGFFTVLTTRTEGNAAALGLVNVSIDGGGQIVFVPEPSTYALLGLGLAGLAGWRRWRNKRR